MPTTSPSYTSRSAGSSTTPLRPTSGRPRTGVPGAVDVTRPAVSRDRVEVLELAADHLGDQVLAGQVVGAGTRPRARPLRRTVMRSEIS